MRQSTRREILFLVFVVLIAISVRAVFTALPRVVRWDEAGYQMIARSLLAGRGYYEVVGARDLQQPPVVSYLSAAGQALGLPIPWSTAAPAHVLLGGLIPIPVYLLGRDLKSRRTGAIAALLVALHPALAVSPLYWSTMTEPPYVLCMLCGTYFAWRAARDGRWRWVLAMGASFGLAYLTRPEALAYLLALLVFILLWRGPAVIGHFRTRQPAAGGGRGRARFGPALRLAAQAAAALVVFLLVCSPYIVYVHRVTGRWALSGKQGVTMGIAWAYAQNSQAEHDRVTASLDPSGKEIVWLSSEQYDVSLLGWVREDPGRFARLAKHNIASFASGLFAEDLFQPWQIILIALGLFAVPWTRHRLGRNAFLIFALAPTLSLIAFFVLSRFMAYVVPLGMIWAAEGVDVLSQWGVATGRSLAVDGRPAIGRLFAGVRWVVLPGLCVLLLLECASVTVHERGSQPFYRVEAAAWLAQHVPAGTPVMVRDTEIPLYAHLPQVAFPNATWAQTTAYGLAHGARYVVIDDKEIRTIRPSLSPLLDPTAKEPLPGLTPVARLNAGGRTTLIFALAPG